MTSEKSPVLRTRLRFYLAFLFLSLPTVVHALVFWLNLSAFRAWSYFPKSFEIPLNEVMVGYKGVALLGVVLLAAETSAAACLVGWVQRLERATARYIGLVLIVAGHGIWNFLLFASWTFFRTTGRFFSPADLRLVEFASDLIFGVAREAVSIWEWAFVLGVVLVSFTLAMCPLVAAQFERPQPRKGVILLGCFLGTAVFIPLLGKGYLSAPAWDFVAERTKRQLMPHISLFWAPVTTGSLGEESFEQPEDWSLRPAETVSSVTGSHKGSVLVIVVEALRGDVLGLVVDGKEVTPNINRLAASGLSFRGYSASPETSESILSIMTSLHALKSKDRDLRTAWTFPYTTVWDVVHAAGYQTALIWEAWSMDKKIMDRAPIDIYLDPQEIAPEHVVEGLNPRATMSFLGQYSVVVADDWKLHHTERILQTGKPTVALVYLMGPHFPYELFDGVEPVFGAPPVQDVPSFLHYDSVYTDAYRRRYYNLLHHVDGRIGEMVSRLKVTAPELRVLITGDHGEGFHEHGMVTHGGQLYEEIIGVPLVLSGPNIQSNVTPDTPVGHVDMAPTVLSLLDLASHPAMQGSPFAQAADATRTPEPHSGVVYASSQMFTREDTVVAGHWKWTDGEGGTALYDLSIDSGETKDLKMQNPEIAKALGDCLERFRERQLYYFWRGNPQRSTHLPPQHRCDLP